VDLLERQRVKAQGWGEVGSAKKNVREREHYMRDRVGTSDRRAGSVARSQAFPLGKTLDCTRTCGLETRHIRCMHLARSDASRTLT
jgi:hypothetical protein